MLDIRVRAGNEVVETKDLMPFRQETLTEVGADKAGSSGYDGTHAMLTSTSRTLKTTCPMLCYFIRIDSFRSSSKQDAAKTESPRPDKSVRPSIAAEVTYRASNAMAMRRIRTFTVLPRLP